MNKSAFQKGLKDGIPIGLGYFAVSFTFGIMAIQAGLSAWQAVLISLTNLTSAGQFAGIGIIAAGGSLWEMALTQLVINLRYCLMSFSLSQKLEKGVSNGHRLAVAFGVTDEIFGVSASQEGRISPWYNYGVMCVAIPGWTLGTLAGAVSGNLLPDFLVSALSVAIYGMFLAVIIPPAKKNRAVLGVVIGAMAVSTLFATVPVLNKVSTGFVIIITTVLVAGIAARIPYIAKGSANAPIQPAAARLAIRAASMTHSPITNAPAHLASKKRKRYCPTVICMVQRIRAGTL